MPEINIYNFIENITKYVWGDKNYFVNLKPIKEIEEKIEENFEKEFPSGLEKIKQEIEAVLDYSDENINGYGYLVKNDTLKRFFNNSSIDKEQTYFTAIRAVYYRCRYHLFPEKFPSSKGEKIKINFRHDENVKECSIEPVQTSTNEYKLGLWVRDSEAGVGTVSFYEPSTKSFGALGHGITDMDTEQLINISSGEFITTKILNIVKGESGNPGRIQGTIDNQKNIGIISKNTKFGVYGKVDNLSSLKIDTSKEMEVALRDEIKTGKATIMCSVENDKIEEYEIEIEKIYKENNYDNKSMLIKITDKRLLDKTGGIIQGMSGSPIIQNRKFVGAVTHVLVNNPTEGYGVFGDIMIKEMKSTK